jgi:Flp pilus assembly protein TadB
VIYRSLIQLSSFLMVGLGATMIVVTIVLAHGFGVGVILGALFMAAGVGRLLMLRRRVER